MTLLTDARNNPDVMNGTTRLTAAEWQIDSIGVHPNNAVYVFFDRCVHPAAGDPALLKSYVTRSYDGGESFLPLEAGDRVQVDTEGMEVLFGRKFEGEGNVLRIGPGALKDDSGGILDIELLTPEFGAGTSLKLLCPMVRSAGKESIRFIVDGPGSVYLVPIDVCGTVAEHEEAVEEGRGKTVCVAETDVWREHVVSTAGLEPGIYFLRAWGGESAILELY